MRSQVRVLYGPLTHPLLSMGHSRLPKAFLRGPPDSTVKNEPRPVVGCGIARSILDMNKPMTHETPTIGHNVREHGVCGDGNTDDAPAIQRLLAQSKPILYFPAGHYRIGSPLRLPSHTRLHAHSLARFQLADGAGKDVNTFLLCNADPERGNENITVRGGIWDGNTTHNPRGVETDRNAYTGVMLNFHNVRNLTLLDMRQKNPSAYHTRLSGVRGFRIERIRFEDTVLAANQDGIHVAGCCEDGLIRDISAVGESCTGDDLIAINADDALDRSETRGKLGGPIRRLRVERLRADDCHSFVRLASVWSTIEDIEITDAIGGCRVNMVNADALRFCLSPLFRKDDERYAGGVGLLRNIHIRNVRVFKTGTDRSPMFRLHERMVDFKVEDFERVWEHDAAREAPTLEVAYVPATEIVLEGVDGLAVEELAAASSCTRFDTVRMVGFQTRTPLHRVVADTDVAGRFVSGCLRFEKFRVEDSRIDPLPEPNWMVAKGQYIVKGR
ncbi:MAG: endopolygalacturonase [Phycisphaera sp.]|nr:endopolygalacturonase [Phycisphaera sp.]